MANNITFKNMNVENVKTDLRNRIEKPEHILGRSLLQPYCNTNSGSRKLMHSTHLEQRLFEDCTKLTQVILPRTVERIEPYMFCGCTSLTSYSIPSSIVSIGNNAFERSGIKSINIPLNVKSIGDSVFIECSQLERVTIPSTVESFGQIVFAFCNKLSTVYINVKFKNYQDVANIFEGTNLITSTDFDQCPAIKWTE